MVVKTEKGWVAMKKDRFTYQVLGTYATRSEATATVAAAVAAPMMGENNFKSMREEIFSQDEDKAPIEEPEAIEPPIEMEEPEMDNRAYLAETLRRVAKEVETMSLTSATPTAATTIKTVEVKVENPETLKALTDANSRLAKAAEVYKALKAENVSLAEQLAAAKTKIDELTKELSTARKTASTWQSKATSKNAASEAPAAATVATAPETVAPASTEAPAATVAEEEDCPWEDHWDHDDASAPVATIPETVAIPAAAPAPAPVANPSSPREIFKAFDAEENVDLKLVSFKPIDLGMARVIRYGLTATGIEFYVFEDTRENADTKTRIVFKQKPSFEEIKSGLEDGRFKAEWFNNENFYREYSLDWMKPLSRDEWMSAHKEMTSKMRELWHFYARRDRDIKNMTDEQLLDVDFEHELNQLSDDCKKIGVAMGAWQHIILEYRMGGCENVTVPIEGQYYDMDGVAIGKPCFSNYSCCTMHNKINNGGETTRTGWEKMTVEGVRSLVTTLKNLRKRYDEDEAFRTAYYNHQEDLRYADMDVSFEFDADFAAKYC